MSKKFDIKPPVWPKELTFQEFKQLNPQINENQLIPLYNQYLGKFLEELRQQKVHYKVSANKQLVTEFKNFTDSDLFDEYDSYIGSPPGGGGGGYSYICTGIGCYAVGVYLDHDLDHHALPVDEGYPRFTVGRPGPGAPGYTGGPGEAGHSHAPGTSPTGGGH
jgi:hypothetical protein